MTAEVSKWAALMSRSSTRSLTAPLAETPQPAASAGDEFRAQERQWDDGHPVRASVGLRAGVQHDGIDASVAELVTQPQQVLDIAVGDSSVELDFDSDDSLLSLDDEVDFTPAALGAQVVDVGVAVLREDTHTERRQRLEQRPQESAVALHGGARHVAGEELCCVPLDEPRRERRVGR